MFAKLFRRSPEKQVIAWITKLDLLLSMDAPVLLAVNHLMFDHDLRRLKTVTADISNRLQMGWTLSEGLALHPSVFGSLSLYIAAAECSGNVPAAVHRIAAAYAQLHSLTIPVCAGFTPDVYSLGAYGKVELAVSTEAPGAQQPIEQLLALFAGEELTPGRSVVIAQKRALDQWTCTVDTVSTSGTTRQQELSWEKGRHLMNQVLMMANLNYWDKSKLTSGILMRRGTSNFGFAVQRAYDDMGMLTIAITVVSSEQVA